MKDLWRKRRTFNYFGSQMTVTDDVLGVLVSTHGSKFSYTDYGYDAIYNRHQVSPKHPPMPPIETHQDLERENQADARAIEDELEQIAQYEAEIAEMAQWNDWDSNECWSDDYYYNDTPIVPDYTRYHRYDEEFAPPYIDNSHPYWREGVTLGELRP